MFSGNFLSRLYGGEQSAREMVETLEFLSRLYGGELIRVRNLVILPFLSRLYGGELQNSTFTRS